MTLLSSAHVTPSQYSIETMSVSRTVSEIFSIKEWRELATEGRGRSRRSLKMARFDRSYRTFYWSTIVSIALPCTIFLLRDAHAQRGLCRGKMSVRPCVCQSHAGIVPKRLYISSKLYLAQRLRDTLGFKQLCGHKFTYLLTTYLLPSFTLLPKLKGANVWPFNASGKVARG